MNEEISISITVVTLYRGLKTLFARISEAVPSTEKYLEWQLANLRLHLCEILIKVFYNLWEVFF